MVCCHAEGSASVGENMPATARLSVCVSIFDSHLLMTLSQGEGGACVYMRRTATQHTDMETESHIQEKCNWRN